MNEKRPYSLDHVFNIVESTLHFVTNILKETQERYVFFGGIGSIQRWSFYNIADDHVTCGCFRGTLAQFEDKIRESHEKNPHHLAEYLAAVEFLKEVRKARLQYPKKQCSSGLPRGINWERATGPISLEPITECQPTCEAPQNAHL